MGGSSCEGEDLKLNPRMLRARGARSSQTRPIGETEASQFDAAEAMGENSGPKEKTMRTSSPGRGRSKGNNHAFKRNYFKGNVFKGKSLRPHRPEHR